MGHERTGALPKTQRWTEGVQAIAGFDGDAAESRQIANQSLDNVRARFEAVQRDSGVQAAFKFLTSLAVASSGKPGVSNLKLPENPTPFAVEKALNCTVESSKDSSEYAAIASAAATDAIANWYAQNTEQSFLFGSSEQNSAVWRKAGTGAGFCEVARLFFAKFTERYLNYFVEREASAASRSIEQRDLLQKQLREHIDSVSRHAFETAKITQSFAAGWFNRHAAQSMPNDREISGFLAIAFGKLREDLRREKTD